MRNRSRAQAARSLCVVGLCLLGAVPASAQIVLPPGAQWTLGDGRVAAGGSDLHVGGSLQVQGGVLENLRHVDIQAGGTLDNGGGQIRLAGDWHNGGSFNGASGEVDFVDGLGIAAAHLSGNTGFFDLSFLSSLGKHYVFAVDSVQSVGGLLGIHGTAAAPIQFESSAAGHVASLQLLPGGSQDIAHVGVSDVYATGQPLAPALSNEGGSGNAVGWFGTVVAAADPQPVPAQSVWSLLVLSTALALAAARRFSLSPLSVRGRS